MTFHSIKQVNTNIGPVPIYKLQQQDNKEKYQSYMKLRDVTNIILTHQVLKNQVDDEYMLLISLVLNFLSKMTIEDFSIFSTINVLNEYLNNNDKQEKEKRLRKNLENEFNYD